MSQYIHACARHVLNHFCIVWYPQLLHACPTTDWLKTCMANTSLTACVYYSVFMPVLSHTDQMTDLSHISNTQDIDQNLSIHFQCLHSLPVCCLLTQHWLQLCLVATLHKYKSKCPRLYACSRPCFVLPLLSPTDCMPVLGHTAFQPSHNICGRQVIMLGPARPPISTM